jgi:hypothetical protein
MTAATWVITAPPKPPISLARDADTLATPMTAPATALFVSIENVYAF